MFSQTTAQQKIISLSKRIRAIPGGTSASKTISILIYLIARAQSDKTPTLTSVVAESFPHLRRGAMRDFLNIMREHNYYKDARWSESNSIYTFETGSQLEFFSVDQPEKVRGARRDRLFINEANNIDFSAFEEVEVRTKEFIFLDWNPTNEFWYYSDVKNKRTDVEELTLTYLDNEALSKEIIDSIEQRKERKSWWQVYGLGQLGEVEGKILTGWDIIDELPHQAKLERRGLDFGYTNDETGILDLYYFNGGYVLDEVSYQKGLGNKPIADILLNQEQPQTLVIGDSAEPKSIDEVRSYGVNIIGVAKTRGDTKSETFVKWSFGLMQGEKVSMTKRSTNLIKEYRNLLWATDKNGRILNVEDPACKNHLISAARYAMVSLVPIMQKQQYRDIIGLNFKRSQETRLNPAR
jgi:phage terminase large subunit